MALFADYVFQPVGLLVWLLIGMIAGWLAGVVMKGGGYGIIWDIILGLVGSLIGGFLFSFLMPSDNGTYGVGFFGSIAVSFVGACILIAIVRAVSSNRTRL